MRKWYRIGIAALLVAILSGVAWQILSAREPVYQGRTLSQWLDEYNKAGATNKIEPVSEAIRAVGTNCLPFLLKNIKHTDTGVKKVKRELFGLALKQHLIKLPFYGEESITNPSILALHELGSNAVPLLPALLKLSEDPNYGSDAMMPLLAMGTNSIPALARLCRNTNSKVSSLAARNMAFINAPGTLDCVWGKDWVNGQPILRLSFSASKAYRHALIKLILEHPDAAVRHASVEAVRSFGFAPNSAEAAELSPALIKAMNDADPDVRKAAARTLPEINPSAAQAGVK